MFLLPFVWLSLSLSVRPNNSRARLARVELIRQRNFCARSKLCCFFILQPQQVLAATSEQEERSRLLWPEHDRLQPTRDDSIRGAGRLFICHSLRLLRAHFGAARNSSERTAKVNLARLRSEDERASERRKRSLNLINFADKESKSRVCKARRPFHHFSSLSRAAARLAKLEQRKRVEQRQVESARAPSQIKTNKWL